MSSSKRTLLILGGALVVLTGISALFGSGPDTPSVDTETVGRNRIVETVIASGRIQPEVEVKSSVDEGGNKVRVKLQTRIATELLPPAMGSKLDKLRQQTQDPWPLPVVLDEFQHARACGAKHAEPDDDRPAERSASRDDQGQLVVYNADDLAAGAVFRAALPGVVPFGFHGTLTSLDG